MRKSFPALAAFFCASWVFAESPGPFSLKGEIGNVNLWGVGGSQSVNLLGVGLHPQERLSFEASLGYSRLQPDRGEDPELPEVSAWTYALGLEYHALRRDRIRISLRGEAGMSAPRIFVTYAEPATGRFRYLYYRLYQPFFFLGAQPEALLVLQFPFP